MKENISQFYQLRLNLVTLTYPPAALCARLNIDPIHHLKHWDTDIPNRDANERVPVASLELLRSPWTK